MLDRAVSGRGGAKCRSSLFGTHRQSVPAVGRGHNEAKKKGPSERSEKFKPVIHDKVVSRCSQFLAPPGLSGDGYALQSSALHRKVRGLFADPPYRQ